MKRSSNNGNTREESKRMRESTGEEIGTGPGLLDMDGAHETSQQPQLCRNGCGFYGSAKNEGMCSVCYKTTLQKKNGSGRMSPAISPVASKRDAISTQADSPAPSNSVESAMASLDTRDAATPSKAVSTADTSATKTASTSDPIAIPSATNPSITLTSFSPKSAEEIAAASPVDESSASSSPGKAKKIRCALCRKRIGLTGFRCRCGNDYCSLHRYSDQHNCQFDYKANAQAKIRKENPVVVGEKINKI